MNSDFGWWERRRRELDARWAERTLPVRFTFPAEYGPLFLTVQQFRTYTRTQSGPIPPPPRHIDPYVTNARPSSSDSARAFPRPAFSHVRRHSYAQATSLEEFRNRRQWPPRGLTRDSVLTPREAEDLVVSGASTFKGYWDEIRNAPGYHRFFVVMESEHYRRTDAAAFQAEAFRDISLSITGSADSAFPWMALEQPAISPLEDSPVQRQ